MTVGEPQPAALTSLANEIREASWQLALEMVQEGLHDDQIPSLGRLQQEGQLGDVPTFIVELARELTDPEPTRVRRGGALAARVRDHARVREELGFAPREVVTEFLVLRRVLWRFISARAASLEPGDLLLLERRINDTIDRYVTECVVAYFDRVTLELAEQARRDPLTRVLNHQAFSDDLAAELDRAKRYEHGLTLVGFDVDRFKEINDTHGHPEGDRALRLLARLLMDSLRGSDMAGRMGGDEFTIALIETEPDAAPRFLDRLRKAIAASDLPEGFSISAGSAHYPTEATSADDLVRLADTRVYEAKRTKT